MTAVALSTNTIGDLGIAYGKELSIDIYYNWHNVTNCCSFTTFGWYMTTNSTLPSTNAIFSPTFDTSVVLAMAIQPSSMGNGFFGLYMKHDVAGTQTIAQQDTGLCASAGSCFQSATTSLGLVVGQLNYAFANYLNYTGVGSNGSANNGVSAIDVGSGAGPQYVTVTLFPWFALSPANYYLGFWMAPKSNGNDFTDIQFSYDAASGTPVIQSATPTVTGVAATCPGVNAPACYIPQQATNPTIDTGGFFGPIIRGLIKIGYFIASNIISFFSALFSLMVPVLSGAAAIIGGVFVAILNAFGNIFGDSSLGTQISSAFTQIVAYLSNVFVIAINLWGNVVTMIKNMITFFSTYFTSFQSFVESFLLTIVNLWTPILALWNEVMKWFNAGSMTIQQIIMLDYVVGMFKVYTSGTDGFKDWLDINELFTLKIFKGAYWALDEAYGFVVQLKQLLFGNRISPVTIAGEG
jgi:hypothetical protein